MTTKKFKAVLISRNTNAFGLYGVILVAKDGESWEVGSNSLSLPFQGQVLTCKMSTGQPRMFELGFEIPRRLPDLPEAALAEVWK